MRKHLETDRQILWVTYYRNLYNATHPSEINSPVSSPEPPSVESTGYEWVDPSRKPICFFFSYPIRQRVMVHVRRYDYGRALRHAKYDLLSSRNSGSRMIKRLAGDQSGQWG